MGFGTLFIGYFLLLNVTYFSFTDVIAGLVLTLGANKLSSINKYFKLTQIPAGIFALLGFLELGFAVYTMFISPLNLELYNIIVGALRYLIIGIFTMLILLGIEEVAKEVELEKLPRKARVALPFSLTVFLILAFLELPILSKVIDGYSLTVTSLILLCAFIVIVILNLTVIYGAYMRICMPSELTKKERKSKFKIVEGFKEHEEKRRQEYVEYKINKRKGKKK